MPSPFLLSVETDAGTYVHRYTLGTDEVKARSTIETFTRHMQPEIGERIVTTALVQNGHCIDYFDGREWSSDIDLWSDYQ